MESSNVKQDISLIEQKVSEMQKNFRDSKNLTEMTRSEVVSMEKSIGLLTDDTPKAFFPQINEIFKDFQQEVKHQNDMNDFFQKQLTELKKESSILHQKIIGCNTKANILEESVGIKQSR